MLSGLGYAHDKGVIHQDIKPSNILMDHETDRPLIADFGIAKTAQAEIQKGDNVIGSPLYMAPEQAGGETTDGRSDIYALGMILFEMVAGGLPVRDRTPQEILIRKICDHANLFTKKPSQVSPLVNNELEDIILRALAGKPGDRYQDCRSFTDDLAAFKTRFCPVGAAGGPGRVA